MRSSVAILLSIVLAFVMVTAVGVSAQETEDEAVTNGTEESEEAWQFSTDLYDGVGQALGPALGIGGIAAFILITLGLLLKSKNGR